MAGFLSACDLPSVVPRRVELRQCCASCGIAALERLVELRHCQRHYRIVACPDRPTYHCKTWMIMHPPSEKPLPTICEVQLPWSDQQELWHSDCLFAAGRFVKLAIGSYRECHSKCPRDYPTMINSRMLFPSMPTSARNRNTAFKKLVDLVIKELS